MIVNAFPWICLCKRNEKGGLFLRRDSCVSRARRGCLALALALLLPLCGCASSQGQQPQGLGLRSLAQTPVTGSLEEVAERLSPSVVGIAVRENGALTGIGSGVIVHESGYVLTNCHVAKVGAELTLIFQDGTRGQAQLLWGDGALDLAVLKAEGSFEAAPLGSAQQARVGETVLCIGTPLTLQFQHTVTHGIVSALDRSLQVPSLSGGDELSFLEGLIQTDASINPGNSGGPLLNLRGEVIGIITMKVDQAAGLGFAIPIDIAAPVLEHFVRDGAYETPYLGVYAFDAEIARYTGQVVDMEQGLYVTKVSPGSPAQSAGLQPGDILLYADGRRLAAMLDLRYAIYSHVAGEILELELLRDGRRVQAPVALAAAP